MNDPAGAHRKFDRTLQRATTAQSAFEALHHLEQTLFGVRLFTVMTVDMEAGLARRAFTSDPQSYPGSGTKPIEKNSWFEIVHDRRECFVANSIEDIANVFADHELIESLGCASVLNLPVFDCDVLVATINLLDQQGYFTTERIRSIKSELTAPSRDCVLFARDLAAAGRAKVN